MDNTTTRTRILDTTRRLVDAEGLAHLTIQGVADALGLTKQAVLYWFPNKQILMQELFFESVEAEAEVLVAAVERATNAAEAIENFLRDGFAHHRANLPRFRLIYIWAQTARSVIGLIDEDVARERLYPVTSRFYTALEQKFRADPRFPSDADPRNFAVALHLSLVGHACMRGSLDVTGGEFRQTFEEMLDALVAVTTATLRS